MAHGSPDYWSKSHVDILSQAASYLIQRPFYGGANAAFYQETWTKIDSGILFNISGAGKSYGGYIQLDGVTSPVDHTFNINIEAVRLTRLSLQDIFDFAMYSPNESVLYIVNWDAPNNIYTLGIKPDITFEKKFEIAFDKDSTEDVKLTLEFYYAYI